VRFISFILTFVVLTCDRAGYTLCYDQGQAAERAAGGGPRPSDHSKNFCVGWKDAANGIEDDNCDNPKQPKGIVAGCPNDKNSKANLAIVQLQLKNISFEPFDFIFTF
jgi:hypothetical protein